MSSMYDLFDETSHTAIVNLSGQAFMAMFDLIDELEAGLPNIDFIEQFEYHGYSKEPVIPVRFKATLVAKNAGGLIQYLASSDMEGEIGSMSTKDWLDLLARIKDYAEKNPKSTFRSRYFV